MDREHLEGKRVGDWMKSLVGFPKLRYEVIQEHLRAKKPKTPTENAKTSKAVKFFLDGHVQKAFVASTEGGFLVRANVLASMRQQLYITIVHISADGEIREGHCGCVAG